MNKSIAKGQWDTVKGKIKQRWGKLTDDNLRQIEGNFDELQGFLEKSYGYSKEQAQREFDTFQQGLDSDVKAVQPEIEPGISPDRKVDQPEADMKSKVAKAG